MEICNREFNQRSTSLRNTFVSMLEDTSISFCNIAVPSSYEKHFTFCSSSKGQYAKSYGKEHIVEIASNAASDKSIWLGYTERWRSLNSNAEFVGSIQRYYYCSRTSALETTKADEFQLVFRIECEALNANGTPRVGYAKPHFHCHLMDGQAYTALLKSELDQPRIDAQKAIDFDPSTVPQRHSGFQGTNHDSLGWISHIHFPIIADWLPGVASPTPTGPPCFVPEELAHLDRWITSSVRYFRSQLNTYLC